MRFHSFLAAAAVAVPSLVSYVGAEVLNFDDLSLPHGPGCGCCNHLFAASEDYHGFRLQGEYISIFNTTQDFYCHQSAGGGMNVNGASSKPSILQARSGNITLVSTDPNKEFTLLGAQPSTIFRYHLWDQPFDVWLYTVFKGYGKDGKLVATDERGFLTDTSISGMGPWKATGLKGLKGLSSVWIGNEWRYEKNGTKYTEVAELYLDDVEYEFES